MLPPSTQRLLFRQPTRNDADLVYALDSDPEVVRFIQKPLSREESLQHLHEMLLCNILYQNQLGFWVVEDSIRNRAVGWLTLKPLEGLKEVELGARILPEYQNQGYAYEAAQAVLSYAWSLGLKRVFSLTAPGNQAPQRVLRKLGFRFEQKTVFYDQDVHLYCIQAPRFA